MKKVLAILTADWHLREDTPICRKDNFEVTQWKKVDFISDLQRQHDCVVLHAGDLFDYWKPSPYLLSQTILHLPRKFYTVYGNHDLPQHDMLLQRKSGVYTLYAAKALNILPFFHYNQFKYYNFEFPFETEYPIEGVVAIHQMVYQHELPWPGCTDYRANELISAWKKKMEPSYKVLLTGDNHKSFVVEDQGIVLVNPGSLTRQKADQIDHQPCVYLLYSDYSVEKVYLPFDESAVTREHLVNKKERDERLEAFVSSLSQDWEAELDYEKEVEKFLKMNNISESVKSIVYRALDN